MIESIRRIDATVLLEINTDLCIKSPVEYFSFDAGTERSAELLRKHLCDLKHKAHQAIARNCLKYLDRDEISKLKSKLVKEWNGNKHCWK